MYKASDHVPLGTSSIKQSIQTSSRQTSKKQVKFTATVISLVSQYHDCTMHCIWTQVQKKSLSRALYMDSSSDLRPSNSSIFFHFFLKESSASFLGPNLRHQCIQASPQSSNFSFLGPNLQLHKDKKGTVKTQALAGQLPIQSVD